MPELGPAEICALPRGAGGPKSPNPPKVINVVFKTDPDIDVTPCGKPSFSGPQLNVLFMLM